MYNQLRIRYILEPVVSDILLATKFYIPPSLPNLVHRQRLEPRTRREPEKSASVRRAVEHGELSRDLDHPLGPAP